MTGRCLLWLLQSKQKTGWFRRDSLQFFVLLTGKFLQSFFFVDKEVRQMSSHADPEAQSHF